MRILIIFWICSLASVTEAGRVVSGITEEVESTTNFGSSQGFRTIIRISCQNMSKLTQTITVEARAENMHYHMCVANQDSTIGANWVASGACARDLNLDSSEIATLSPRVKTISLAPESDGEVAFEISCVAMLNGVYCSQSDVTKWTKFNFAVMSDEPRPNECKTKAGATIANCVKNATATYRGNYRISTAEDRGAILCGHSAKIYLAKVENYSFGMFSNPVNGGRPF